MSTDLQHCPTLRDIYPKISPGTEVVIEYSHQGKEAWYYTKANDKLPVGFLSSRIMSIEARDRNELYIKVNYAGGTG